MNRCIDLNCDLGEGAGQDSALMPLVTSANIACGGHAGDEATMRATLRLAKQHGVAAGAHPGYEDRRNFGRLEQALSPEAVYELVLRQVRTLQKFAAEEGVLLRHVKPHGALYNVAARDREIAKAVAAAVRDSDSQLALYALSGSLSARAGAKVGLSVVHEVFADRAYREDGTLVPRNEAGAVHGDETVMLNQVLGLVVSGEVRANSGALVAVRADTLCLHGDGAHAVTFAREIRQVLTKAGVVVLAPG